MKTVYVVWHNDCGEGDKLYGVFSTKEIAQKFIDRECKEEFEGEAMYSPEDFSISSHDVDYEMDEE
jgi:hypothetical protein